jgi:Flp pilus assembly protein CpaB
VSASPLSTSESNSPTSTGLRILPNRRSVPGSRSIVGAALVALAVLGTYLAAAGSGDSNSRTVAVATRDIAPGTRLSSSDFRTQTVDIDDALADRLVTSPSKLNGTTILGPLTAGDMVATSAVVDTGSSAPYLEMSFALPASRALDGALRPGETVDVLTTDKSSPTPSARTAAANARVLRTQSGNGSLGEGGDVIITVGVTSKSEIASIAAAVDLGQVTLVRTTGVTNR